MKRIAVLIILLSAAEVLCAQGNNNNGNSGNNGGGNDTFVQHRNLRVNKNLYVLQNTELSGQLRVEGLSFFNNSVSIGSTTSPTETLDIFGNLKTRGTVFAENLNVQFSAEFGEDLTVGRDLSVGRYGSFQRVGIGLEGPPTEALDVNGNARINQTVFAETINAVNGLYSGNVSIEGNQFTNGNAFIQGNVGIGVESPAEKLEIQGNAIISSNVSAESVNANQATFEQTNSTDADISNTLSVGGAATFNDALSVAGNAALSLNLSVGGNNTITGNLGVGVAEPVEKVEVQGNVKVSDGVSAQSMSAVQGSFETVDLDNADVTNTLIVGGATTLNDALTVEGNAALNSNLNVGGNSMVSGNLGIGVATPTEKVEVQGNVKVSDKVNAQSVEAVQGSFDEMSLTSADVTETLTVGGATTLNDALSVAGNTSLSSNLSVGGNNTITGNLGIGVEAPTEKVEVQGNVKVSDKVNAQSVEAVQGSFDEMSLTRADVTETLTVGGATTLNDALSVAGNTALSSNLSVGGNNTITGNLGIGVAAPTEKVEVQGNVKVSDKVNAQSVEAVQGSFDEMSLTSADVTETLTVGGATTLNDALSVAGNTALSSNLSVGGNNTITGNLGIGVANPVEKVEVQGNVKVSGSLDASSIEAEDINLDNAALGTLSVSENASLSKDLSVTGQSILSGKVGIGVAAPAEKLEVAGNVKSTGSILADGATFANDLTVKGGLSVSNKSTFNGSVTADQFTVSTQLNLSGGMKLSSISSSESSERFLVADANGNLYYRNLDSFQTFKEKEGENNLAIEEGKTFSVATLSTPVGYAMAVGGDVLTSGLTIKKVDNWPDYVFEDGYKLRKIEEIASFIEEEGHLPEVPTAKEVEENGVKQEEMNALLLKKIEELTLYVIELKKENEEMKKLIQSKE